MRTWTITEVETLGGEKGYVVRADDVTVALLGDEPLARFIVDACNAQEQLSDIRAHPEQYRATPFDPAPWGPAMKIGGRSDEVAEP